MTSLPIGGRRQQETDSTTIFSSNEIVCFFSVRMSSSSDETAASTLGALSAAGTLPHLLSRSQQQSFPEPVFHSDWLPPAKTEKASRNVSPYHNIKQTAIKHAHRLAAREGGTLLWRHLISIVAAHQTCADLTERRGGFLKNRHTGTLSRSGKKYEYFRWWINILNNLREKKKLNFKEGYGKRRRRRKEPRTEAAPPHRSKSLPAGTS